VTINDIREAAKIYLTRENLTIVKLMPNAPKETKTEEESLPKNGLISKKAVLANGLRVIAIEDKKLPLTSIGAVCLGGVRFEDKEKNGISNLTANVLIKGTSSLDESKISGLIESLGGSLSAFSGNNSFGVTLRLLSKDLDTGLGLLHDIINNPSFDAKILDREKNLVLAEIKSQDEDIFQKGMNKFKKTLFKDLPYGLRPLGEEAPLNKLTREDLLSFYKSCKDTQNMTLAVVGDIDPDAVIKKCESLFSDIAPDGHRKPDLPNMIASEGPREYRDSIDKEQSIVIIGFPGAQIDNKDRYALDVISSILSGSDGRLFSNLRSKLGISYAQGAISVPGLEPGYFATYIATTKDNIDTAKNGMIEEIGRIKNEYVSDEELESVKRALINIKRSNLQSISDIMLEVSLDELYGLGYDNYSIYEENINGITTEDIKTAANKYFDMNNLTTAIIEGTK